MRKINLQPPSNQDWLNWLQTCKKETEDDQKLIAQGKQIEIKDNIYKKHKDFFGESQFHGKCAYCECQVIGFQHGDVEHFRPKKAVTDEMYQLIEDHPGYYWLAYDWQNLLLSCSICNGSSKIKKSGNIKIGKLNRFPVIGEHAKCPEELINEQPLLINPTSPNEEDDPAKHLGIDLETGYIIPLSERGEMCIKIFGLNLREDLVTARLDACLIAESYLEKLKPSNSRLQKDKAIADIQKILQGKKSYTLVQTRVIAEYRTNLNRATS
jgi:uncharacterized protein (TIGR02646 family)